MESQLLTPFFSRLNPRSCVVFEDAIAGIEAAKAAGMYSVGLTTYLPAEALHDANICIPDFRSINPKGILELLESAQNKA